MHNDTMISFTISLKVGVERRERYRKKLRKRKSEGDYGVRFAHNMCVLLVHVKENLLCKNIWLVNLHVNPDLRFKIQKILSFSISNLFLSQHLCFFFEHI